MAQHLNSDVIRTIGNFMPPSEVVRLIRVSPKFRRVLNNDYLRGRVAKALNISIAPTSRTSNWYQMFQLNFDTTLNTNSNYKILVQSLPKASLLEWFGNRNWKFTPQNGIWTALLDAKRYDFILPAIAGGFDVFFNNLTLLLVDPECPLEVLAPTFLEFSQIANTQPTELLRTLAYSNLSNSQVLDRTILLDGILNLSYTDKLLSALTNDNIIQLSYYVDMYRTSNQDIDSLEAYLYDTISNKTTGYNIGKVVVPTYSDEMFLQKTQKFNFENPNFSSYKKSFYAAVFSDPRFSINQIITDVVPIISISYGNSKGNGYSISRFVYFGVPLEVFSDSRAAKYLSSDDIYELLAIHWDVFPYNNQIGSRFFQLLTYVPHYLVRINYKTNPDGYLGHYKSIPLTRAVEDPVLLRNLITTNNLFIVSVLLRNVSQNSKIRGKYTSELTKIGSAKSLSTVGGRQKATNRLLEIIQEL